MAAAITIGQVVETETSRTVDRTRLLKAAALAMWPPFLARVTASVASYALTLGNQIIATGTSGSASVKFQYLLCVAALEDPQAYGKRFAWVIAANNAVGADIADDAIDYRVTQAWNLIAGGPVG